MLVELEPGNYHLIARSFFSDGKTGNWAIDTGASKTVFDKNLLNYYVLSEDESNEIHSAGIGEKPLETKIGHLNTITFGKLKLHNLKVALLDLSHINQLYRKATNMEICGLIGGDLLSSRNAVIDYKRKLLTLKQSN